MTDATRRHARRLVQGVASQGLSALGNFLLVVMVARTSTPESFGAFAIAYSLTQLVLVGIRASIGETLAVTDAEATASRAAVGGGVVIGLVAGLAMLCAGLFVQGALGMWLVTGGTAMPVLAWQEGGRSSALASGQTGIAALSEAIWLAVLPLGWGLSAAVLGTHPRALFAVWVAGAAVGASAAALRLGWPHPRNGLRWLRDQRRLGTSLGIDSLLSMGAGQASVYALGAIAGLPAAGALRGAESLYGPIRTVVVGTTSVSLPEARVRRDVAAVWPFTIRVSVALVTTASAGTAVLSSLPDAVGLQLLGDTWLDAAVIMPQVGLTSVGLAAAAGPRIGLRASQRTGAVLRLRAVTSTAVLAGGVGGALVGGLTGAASGVAASQLAAAAWSWIIFRRETSSPRQVT